MGTTSYRPCAYSDGEVNAPALDFQIFGFPKRKSCVQNINPLAELCVCVMVALLFPPVLPRGCPRSPLVGDEGEHRLCRQAYMSQNVFITCAQPSWVLCVLLVSALASIDFWSRLELLNDLNSKVDPSPAGKQKPHVRCFPLEIAKPPKWAENTHMPRPSPRPGPFNFQLGIMKPQAPEAGRPRPKRVGRATTTRTLTVLFELFWALQS